MWGWHCCEMFSQLEADFGPVGNDQRVDGHPWQLDQPRVGDLGAVEIERLQVGQPFKMHQPRVSDLGTAEAEFDGSTLVILLDLCSQFLERGNRIAVIGLCRLVIDSVCWSLR